MKLTYSTHPKAVASRKWRLSHPGKQAAYNKKYYQNPKNKAKAKAYFKSWYYAHHEYMKEYWRIYQAMTKAFKAGNAVLGEKLKVDFILLKQSLEDRKGIGGTPVFA